MGADQSCHTSTTRERAVDSSWNFTALRIIYSLYLPSNREWQTDGGLAGGGGPSVAVVVCGYTSAHHRLARNEFPCETRGSGLDYGKLYYLALLSRPIWPREICCDKSDESSTGATKIAFLSSPPSISIRSWIYLLNKIGEFCNGLSTAMLQWQWHPVEMMRYYLDKMVNISLIHSIIQLESLASLLLFFYWPTECHSPQPIRLPLTIKWSCNYS